MAIVEVDVTPDNGKPANRIPMQIQLTRTDQGWKLSQAGAVNLSSQ
jgi:hypothetical protein